MRTLIAPLFAFFLAYACTPSTPAKPPPPDSFDLTQADAGVAEDQTGPIESKGPVARACDNLAALKCIEGLKRDAGDTCIESINHVISSHLTRFDTACVIAAKSQAAARACAGASCTPAK
jgi:hypothetical protein